MTMPPFVDMGNRTEEERIMLIGRSVMGVPRSSADKPIVVGFVVEDPEKAERYIQKLKENFPGIRIIDKIRDCPFKGVVTVKISSPLR